MPGKRWATLAEAGDTWRAQKCYRQMLALRPDDLEAQVGLEKLRQETVKANQNTANNLIIELENWHTFSIPLWFQVFPGLFSFLAILMLAAAQQ